MRVAEAARILQAVAKHAVEADVGDQDQRQRQDDRRAERKACKRNRQRKRIGMDEIVGERARPWPDEIVMDSKTRALVDGKWKALAKELGID